ncbi:MAG: N-acetyltransferase [Oscillospiraceae bacterium]|nr:N-acetyltransferase [Oscillospiraceae bacterium]
MDGYRIVRLKAMLDQEGELAVKQHLSLFSCQINKDVEYFLRSRAIEFSKQSIANTFLVYCPYKGSPVLTGYFTLTIKAFDIPSSTVSKSMAKKICKFGTYVKENKAYRIPAPLIAQLGKNDRNGYNKLISGDELLKMAIDKIALALENLGGKLVYLECEDIPYLLSFYESNGFVCFGERRLDREEEDRMKGKYLKQFLRIIST